MVYLFILNNLYYIHDSRWKLRTVLNLWVYPEGTTPETGKRRVGYYFILRIYDTFIDLVDLIAYD